LGRKIKEQVMKDRKTTDNRQLWKDFLISVLGTAIGVGLTFAVSKIVENNKKEEAQHVTAMMIIDDMEKSLDIVRFIKEDEEQRDLAAQYVLEHLTVIDSISYDTLSLVANYIIDGSFYSTETEFSESGEKIFQSAQDAWMNLNDISFIRSVDEFYKSRAVFRDAMQTHYSWRKPVSKAENDELLTNTDILESWEKYNTYLKGRLSEPKTLKFINQHSHRMQFYDDVIEQWSSLIADCKNLMDISDAELEEFRK
jgi:hypothetical protein